MGASKRSTKRVLNPPPKDPSEDEDSPVDELESAELDLSSEDVEDEAAASPSGSEGEDGSDGEEDVEDEEVKDAMLDYAATVGRLQQEAAARRRGEELVRSQAGGLAAAGSEDGDDDDDDSDAEDRPVDPGSDSSEDERPNRNTVGNVPLHWYKDEDHIGYDLDGKKIGKSVRKDRLEQLLDRNDSKKAMRTIYDEYNDEEIVLSKEELAMIMRIRKGQFPSAQINPYEPYVDWFTRDVEKMPIRDDPVPKRRFVPSKHEEKKIVKLVRAMRKGWLKTSEQKQKAEEPPVYLLWGDDNMAEASKTATGLSYIPAAKPKLPGHAESYNPPKEYIPSEEEIASYELMDPEDRPKFVPQAYDSLRQVPMYANFIKEVFERCLDLYLAPRVRRKRLNIDPESLVPKLPKPQDLQPFPTHLAHKFTGHTGKVRSLSPDPTGQWLLTGSDDGTLRLWEVRTGRCAKSWDLGVPVASVSWCPAPGLHMVSAAAGNRVVLLPSGLGTQEVQAATTSALEQAATSDPSTEGPAEGELAAWRRRTDGGLEIMHRFAVKSLTWHARGDYFASVAPTGNTQAVLVHQLSKSASQNPFRKNRGRVMRVAFHPSKPFFFVATQNHVRVYNLAKQALAKKLLGGSGVVSCLAVHPSGDHVLVGSEDKRLAWYDMDLSDKPYKALRYHNAALRGAAFHRTYPLFASCSDDATIHIFHGMVYADLLTNPLIVPVKILRGHDIVDHSGVLDVAFHPTQPWVFTAGADGNACLFVN